MSDGRFILHDHIPVEEPDLMKWGLWLQSNDTKVARESVGGVDVSTIFLGLDHSFGDGSPLLFETTVFGGSLDQEMDRYATWDEAVAGHALMKQRVIQAAAA